MSDFQKFKKELPSKGKFYSYSSDRKVTGKKYEHVVDVSKKTEMKTIKNYHDLCLKCDVLLLPDVFEKLEMIA